MSDDPPKWLRADPLAAVLISRGENSEHAYSICERVSVITADGGDEIAAIERVLGYVPHTIRDALTTTPTPSPQ